MIRPNIIRPPCWIHIARGCSYLSVPQVGGSTPQCPPGDGVGTVFGTAGCGCQGNDTCLIEGTEVLMADGSLRRIENLQIDDLISGFDPAGVPQDQFVRQITIARRGVLEFSHTNGSFKCTQSHLVMLPDGTEKRADQCEAGVDRLVSFDGTALDLLEISDGGEGIVYALDVRPTHVFVANGVRHHNKVSPPPGP